MLSLMNDLQLLFFLFNDHLGKSGKDPSVGDEPFTYKVVDSLSCASWVNNIFTTFDLLKLRFKNQRFDTPASYFDQ